MSERFHYRYIGDARIAIRWAGTTPDGRERYEGRIEGGPRAPQERVWSFDDVCSGVGGVSANRCGDGYPRALRAGGCSVDGAAALDLMAETAMGFASAYTSTSPHALAERPEWAPPVELAQAFDNERGAASTERGVMVRRSPNGPGREVLS